MRQVVGADIGYAALHELVELLREGTAEAGLARGCVFYISMTLWGPRRVPTLRVSYLAVLPALLKVSRHRQRRARAADATEHLAGVGASRAGGDVRGGAGAAGASDARAARAARAGLGRAAGHAARRARARL